MKLLKWILIGLGVLQLIAILFVGSLYSYFTYRNHQPFGQLLYRSFTLGYLRGHFIHSTPMEEY